MRKTLYARLAMQNLRRNYRLYIPYLLACTGTIAMYYIIAFLNFNSAKLSALGADTIGALLSFGIVIVALFAAVLLFYTSSFLMKRRKKEFGVYNILGMEKRHIGRILTFETFYLYFVSLGLGLGFGILFSKLCMLLLCGAMHLQTPLTFSVSVEGLVGTVVLFSAIFLLVLLNELRSVHLARPVELLRGSSVGEREPKTKWPLAILGLLCIGGGYYIALTTESPLDALTLFFVAVLLVIIGTYCLFTACSIAVLKLLRANRKFYYQAKHFTTISGMLYRMKQNAVGLASICILCTMVLVTASTTVSLMAGIEDVMVYRFPHDISVDFSIDSSDDTGEAAGALHAQIEYLIREHGLEIEQSSYTRSLSFFAVRDGGQLNTIAGMGNGMDEIVFLNAVTCEEYERQTGTALDLSGAQIAVTESLHPLDAHLTLCGNPYEVVQRLPKYKDADFFMLYGDYLQIVVSDEAALRALEQARIEEDPDRSNRITDTLELDLAGSDAQIVACNQDILTACAAYSNSLFEKFPCTYSVECRAADRPGAVALYGGLLFLGIFLSILFLAATVLIMYYKQVSEGYEDRQRFEILQKVGMTKREIRRSIHSQILMVFFLPLLVAGIHLLAAFKLITKLLLALNMANTLLFAVGCAATFGIFALIYCVVYLLTARTYYKIVT